ncbi:MAG: cell division protein ZapA [SAR86 cluster bacterium]|jgi:cell division protein ZapA (FtsZ GTPase activity inhibitor)|uniref:Cell division protein ZapA n=1 Tax=SAR86 cluster bacterium TaxID=2030880 RepID=A0A520MWC9_9GAMM|nr:MAG: cell division protein ZapA [SAR86 cluster bacterium]|tara:strand:- start:1815 stop:2084 length:270 start_codon:yes stop_codon:yes gene_type:complete
MSKVETVSLRIFGRDLTIACPPKEKDNLIKAANLLNEELDNISDKNNALIIAGLTLANKLLTSEPNNKSSSADADFSKLIKKIEKTLEK